MGWKLFCEICLSTGSWDFGQRQGDLAYGNFGGQALILYVSCSWDDPPHTKASAFISNGAFVIYSKPGDLILDPMCGSGTTALACHALGRRYICIDKESDYVEAARNRLLQFQAQGDLFAGENSALVEENQTNIQQSLYAAGEASVQQLKAEIAAIATEFDRLGPGSCGGEHLKSFYNLVIKLRQLSAV